MIHTIRHSEFASRRADLATIHLELGRDFLHLGNRTEAITNLENSREFSIDSGVPAVQAFAMTEIGSLIGENDVNGAIVMLTEALEKHRSASSTFGEVETLGRLAGLEQKRGRTDQAIELATEAIGIVSELRQRIGNTRLRFTYTGVQWPTYELAIDLLMGLHAESERSGNPVPEKKYGVMALEISEQARALTLRELLRTNADESIVQYPVSP